MDHPLHASWQRACCALGLGAGAPALRDAVPAAPDAQLLVDADLAILGAAPARFDEYERQVREQYAWVPRERFAAARRGLLRQLLARPSLYATAQFQARFEAPARANLARSLARLGNE